MGKLYLNYPMVEAFYHMSSIPDEQYNNRFATLEELLVDAYKMRVNLENRNHDYTKFAADKDECNIVIRQNIDKARSITHEEKVSEYLPGQAHILTAQLGRYVKMSKFSYVITVDENDVRIEKRPIATIRIGDETDGELSAWEAERLAWEQMKLPLCFEALLRWGFRRIWKRFYGTD